MQCQRKRNKGVCGCACVAMPCDDMVELQCCDHQILTARLKGQFRCQSLLWRTYKPPNQTSTTAGVLRSSSALHAWARADLVHALAKCDGVLAAVLACQRLFNQPLLCNKSTKNKKAGLWAKAGAILSVCDCMLYCWGGAHTCSLSSLT